MRRTKCGWRPYFRKHPFEAEYRVSRWFKETFYDQLGPWEAIAVWHRGRNWRDSEKDMEDVRNYRANILTLYRKFYLPTANTLYAFPPKLRVDQWKADRIFRICLIDFPVKVD